MPPIIHLHEAVFGLGEGQPIVGPIDLVIEAGDKVLLDGPSGSGKTSLFRGLLGFLSLLSGEYRLHGEAARPDKVWKLRGETAYISQELVVGSGPVHDWLRDYLPDDVPLHEADLSQFQLAPSVMEQSLEDLSRGERQRLTLVAVAMRKPSLFLLDEITSALNEALRARVIQYFGETQATVLACSHDAAWKRSPSFRSHALTTA